MYSTHPHTHTYTPHRERSHPTTQAVGMPAKKPAVKKGPGAGALAKIKEAREKALAEEAARKAEEEAEQQRIEEEDRLAAEEAERRAEHKKATAGDREERKKKAAEEAAKQKKIDDNKKKYVPIFHPPPLPLPFTHTLSPPTGSSAFCPAACRSATR